jgi:hypothetical protein
MGEIAVGVTDYLLTVECAAFAGMLLGNRHSSSAIRRFFIAFFAFTALASLAGGTSHLLASSLTAVAAAILWKVTIAALGAVAFATWSIGACLLFSDSIRGRVVKAAFIEFLGYSIYVIAIDDHFRVAIFNYIPAAGFLLAAFACSYRRHSRAPVLAGLFGLVVTGAAAAIQRLGLSLHPAYFNHNATYHLVQAIGLALIFCAAVFFTQAPRQEARNRS